MALATHVQARYATDQLANLTNPNDRTATTVGTTYLGYAVTAAQSDFLTYAHLSYDDTNEEHVEIGCEGVVAHLHKYGAVGAAAGISKELLDDFRARLRQLALGGPRARITPTSTSVLTPSPEQTDAGETVRPDFDRERFRDLIPSAPRLTDADDEAV